MDTLSSVTTETEHMPSEERLRELLFGKKVVDARIVEDRPETYSDGPTGILTLSDGTVLKVWGNDGGCSCSAGCYPLTDLNACDNVITNVVIEDHPVGDGDESDGHYRIFVFAEDQRTMLASFDGSDGNGYYGTGWWLTVTTTDEHAVSR